MLVLHDENMTFGDTHVDNSSECSDGICDLSAA